MKIYTKKGDEGNTALFGGEQTTKTSPRIEAYGTVDELNSVLGMVLSSKPSPRGNEILTELQSLLFVLGADLATPEKTKARIDRIEEHHIELMESYIDELEENLPPLKSFILPGGTPAASALHLARTVCRRAERAAFHLKEIETVSDHLLIFLNRLSDLLFVMARYENHAAGKPDTPWIPERKS